MIGQKLTMSLSLVLVLSVACATLAADQSTPDKHASEFANGVLPLLQKYCLDCHSTEDKEGELDLERFKSLAEIRRDLKAWEKVAEMLGNGEMPPKDKPQLSDEQRKSLIDWTRGFLNAEALARAGDPGRVPLRRLSNSEYTYTIHDLTGVNSLEPTREFPVDGAAGEGFTNVGSAQGMAPSLVQKYLDAAKDVADHAVLLPDRIGFSPYTTQRDQTDELVGRIQAFYRQFTADGGGQAVNLQGIKFDTNQGGVLPLEKYIAATLQERLAILAGKQTIADVARERSLNEKYLTTVWQKLSAKDHKSSLWMDELRRKWAVAKAEDAAKITAAVAETQKVLWRFNSIGHIGVEGKPKIWMEPASPIVAAREFSMKLPESGRDVSVSVIAADAGDGHDHDYVVWQNPRLVVANGPDLSLRDLAGLQRRIRELKKEALSKTTSYLAAAAEIAAVGSDISTEKLTELAARHQLDVNALNIWLDYLAIRQSGPAIVTGHFTEAETNGNYDFVKGWGTGATPLILGNSSDREVRIPGISRPQSIQAHPSPTLFVAAGWQSPVSGLVQVEARLSDVHPECGNGQEWFVQHRTSRQVGNLSQGDFPTGGSAKMPPTKISVRKGELISLILGPREGNHSCDLTEINLVITELNGEKRTWDLAKDVSGDILAANPHADSHGNAKIWHFYKGEMKSVNQASGPLVSVPAGSLLARWQQETDNAKRAELAKQIQTLAIGEPPPDANSPDRVLYEQLTKMTTSSHSLESLLTDVEADERFGKHPLGQKVNSTDLIVQAPSILTFTIPSELAQGRTFVATGRLDSKEGAEGSVQVEIRIDSSESYALGLSSPIVANEGSEARKRVESSLAEFRNLFPPALCYARIVPVDEVVTLTLYYRQDDHLQRLMLNKDQIAELDQLWDDLFYVAHEPLEYQVAFEQIREFATQDRPDLVKTWAPLVKAVDDRADAFRKRLIETEQVHVQSLLEFADRAWRRKLTDAERASLQGLYQSLREAELPHDEAIRLTIARILTSPAFLYRREQPGPGDTPTPVTGFELASRLSYFLWSSMPDVELMHAAEAGELSHDDLLLSQTRRLLKDSRTRRLAVEFACQWLHLREFDKNDDKNEKLYPEFARLRHDMYEETVRFFEDMFRNDGSILSILEADYTFVNESLAKHYGIDGVGGNQWQRIGDVRSKGRGGVLGMATFLASQSGASRTSPILRGNWVYETLLGERLPRPPANVPQLPDAVPNGLTARQLIERHSSVAECAKCHAKIDPFGFALEQYDAIGRLRSQSVDTKTKLQDGRAIEGIDGLRNYLTRDRRNDVIHQFCRKLLGYSLGREVQLSDGPLLEEMQHSLAANEYRFSVAVEMIVKSQQFREIRGRQAVID